MACRNVSPVASRALRPRRRASAISGCVAAVASKICRLPSARRVATTIGDALGDCSIHILEESQIRFGIETRHVDANFSAARQTRPPCGFVGDAEVQGFRAAGLDNVEAGCDDVGFDAAPGNGALKLIDTGNGQLAAGADRRGAPSINDRRDGNRAGRLRAKPGRRRAAPLRSLRFLVQRWKAGLRSRVRS